MPGPNRYAVDFHDLQASSKETEEQMSDFVKTLKTDDLKNFLLNENEICSLTEQVSDVDEAEAKRCFDEKIDSMKKLLPEKLSLKDMFNFLRNDGSACHVKDPYGGEVMLQFKRSTETAKKSLDLIQKYQKNVLDDVWYRIFQNENSYTFTLDSPTFDNYSCTLTALHLIAQQETSMVVKCEVKSITTGKHRYKPHVYLSPGMKVCVKVAPKVTTDFQINTEMNTLKALWGSHLKKHPENEFAEFPFPKLFFQVYPHASKAEETYMVTDLFHRDVHSVFMEMEFPSTELRWSRVRATMIQLINILDICHSYGILHKDVKPENVMYRGEDLQKLVLMDFGIAQNMNMARASSETTQKWGQEGTPYCADIRQHQAGFPMHAFIYDLQAVAWCILWLMEEDRGPIFRAPAGNRHNEDGSVWTPNIRDAKYNFINNDIEATDPYLRKAHLAAQNLIHYTLNIFVTPYTPAHYARCKEILNS